MKLALRIAGAVLLLMGTIWFFQGINVLPGSFMSGQTRWAVIGAVADIVGLILLMAAGRRRLHDGPSRSASSRSAPLIALIAAVAGATQTIATVGGGPEWRMIGHDSTDSRTQPFDPPIRPANPNHLAPKW